MVLRVLDALDTAQEIGPLILCGPPKSVVDQEAELRARVESGKVKWVENQSTPSSSAYHVLQSLPESTLVLLTTADHALLNPQIVDHFCSSARTSGCDIVAGLASSELVGAAYPDMRRTVTRLRDGGYCSCNLFAFLTPRAHAAADFWRRVENQRKKPLRVISVIGWMAVFRYLLGRLTLTEGLNRLSQRLGFRVGTVLMPFPEAAVDVDTVDDWMFAQTAVRDQAP